MMIVIVIRFRNNPPRDPDLREQDGWRVRVSRPPVRERDPYPSPAAWPINPYRNKVRDL